MSTKVKPPPSLFSSEDLPTFSLYDLFQEILNSSINSLVDFQEKLEDFSSDQEKKKILFTYFSSTREKLLRILVLIKFLRKTEQADYFQEVGSKIKDVLGSYNLAAETFHNSMIGVGNMRERKFDIDTAVRLFSTGTYDLPSSIHYMEENEVDEKKKVIINQRVNDFINLRLLKEDLPKTLIVDRNEEGRIKLIHPHEYKVTLTIDQEFRWKILKIKLLVNELGVTTSPVSFGILQNLKFLITRIFHSKKNTRGVLTRMDEILHELCLKLAMDIISGQAKHLSKLVFKDIIKTETPYLESQDRFSVKLLYWKVNPNYTAAENIKIHPLFTPLDSHHGLLTLMVNEQKELQVEHHPVLHDDVNNPQVRVPKIFNLDEIDVGMLWQKYLFQLIVSRLRVVMRLIAAGRYYNGEKLFLHLGPGKPCLTINLFENWQVRLGMDWTSGEYVFSYLHYGRDVPMNEVKGLNSSMYILRLHEDIATISKSVFEIKMHVMMNGYEEAATFLKLRYYDEKRVLRFLKSMGHYVAKKLRERKCLYIPFPNIPLESWNYLVVFPSVVQENQRFRLNVKASLLLYQGKKMTLIDLDDETSNESKRRIIMNNNNQSYNNSRKRGFDDVKSYQDEKAESRPIELPDDSISSTSESKRLKTSNATPSTNDTKSTLTHLRYLLAKHRHLVMRNILFQELTRRFPFFQVRGPDRVSFSYRLKVGGTLSLLLVVLPSGLWEVRCKFFEITFEGMDTSVMKNFRFVVVNNDDDEKKCIKAVFSYPEDALWRKFLSDLTAVNRMLYLHYQFMGIPISSKEDGDDEEEEGEEGVHSNNNMEDEHGIKCHHCDTFRVESSLKSIMITYDVEKNYRCEIRWSDTRRKFEITLTPESGLSSMMERLLDNEGGRVSHIVNALSVSSKYIMRLKDTLTEKYLWTLIPRNLATFCLIYQSPNIFQCCVQFSQRKAIFYTANGVDRRICKLEECERAFQRYCYYVQLRIILSRYSGEKNDKIFLKLDEDQYQLKSKKYILHLEKLEGKLRISRGKGSSNMLERLNSLVDDMVQDRCGESHKFLYDKMKSFILFIRLPHRILDEIVEGVESFEDESNSVEIQWVVPRDLNLPYSVFQFLDKNRFRVGRSCLTQFQNKNKHNCVNLLLRLVKKGRKRMFTEYLKQQQKQQAATTNNNKKKKKMDLLYHVDIPFLYNMETRDIDIAWRDFLKPGAVFGKTLGLKPKDNQKSTASLKNAIAFLRNQRYDMLMQIR